MTGALHFLTIVGHVNGLVRAERAKILLSHSHIGLIAENVFSLFQFMLDGRRHQAARSGPKSDNDQLAALSTDKQHICRG